MATYRFQPARGPAVISSFKLKYVFVLWISFPAFSVLLAFLIGFGFHPKYITGYQWGCRVVQLPSVSRILNFPLERIAWNLLTLASMPLHFFIIIRQYILTYSSSNLLQFSRIVLVISGAFQSIFLSLLATVGERESGLFHVAFFCGFTCSTLTNYTVFSILMKCIHSQKEDSCHSRRRMKILLSLMMALPIICLFFVLHNVFCIPGAYEAFAIFEYITLILIFWFHCANYYIYSNSDQTIIVCHTNAILSTVKL